MKGPKGGSVVNGMIDAEWARIFTLWPRLKVKKGDAEAGGSGKKRKQVGGKPAIDHSDAEDDVPDKDEERVVPRIVMEGGEKFVPLIALSKLEGHKHEVDCLQDIVESLRVVEVNVENDVYDIQLAQAVQIFDNTGRLEQP